MFQLKPHRVAESSEELHFRLELQLQQRGKRNSIWSVRALSAACRMMSGWRGCLWSLLPWPR